MIIYKYATKTIGGLFMTKTKKTPFDRIRSKIKFIVSSALFILRHILTKIRYGNKIQCKSFLLFKHDTNLNIVGDSSVYIGKSVGFKSGVHLTAAEGGVLKIGDRCAFNRFCIVVARKNIEISDNCIFGPNVVIYDHDHKFSENGVEKGYNCGDIFIGEGCWIAANVTILRNTHIGEKCVIGAGAVVKGDIPPHSIVTADRSITVKPIKKKRDASPISRTGMG